MKNIESSYKKIIFEKLRKKIFSNEDEKIKILDLENYKPEWIVTFLNESKNDFQNLTLILFNYFDEKYYFYLLSNLINVNNIFNFLKINFDCKGGGNEKYIQGLIKKDEDIFKKLKDFCKKFNF